ncbi:MAG: DEAD/DEAH box helicase family protein, partial [Candidatus Nanopelagicales bacterium]|nr:DEAD/DEAH box helicase family protein [Candidatus Nanopelagicales bacterium]MDZ4249690.1 DEAD/DEAH box helicase family protein [Candidatus Nanopelagicales bacterium]
MKPDEFAFESEVAAWLAEHGGYESPKFGNVPDADFRPALGLDTADLFTFIGATQIDAWDRLVKLYGSDPDTAQRSFAERLAKQLDQRGTVDVLRHGVVDHGVTIQLAYFRPAHGLTPELTHRYEANRLVVTRQLRFAEGSTETVDLCLSVNGLPVATAELKNPLTGQNIDNAKRQYRDDRDPRNTTLARRAVVHFAVDTEAVAITTRLSGGTTRFLPFNKGTGLGAGNPGNPHGHRSSYLWEQVWERDAWLDLLARFVHVRKPEEKGGRAEVVFPRFHQWDAVRELEAAARADGPGHDYLVEHSAGSGKSNTIAWLAHRLSSLHDAADAKVFDKVVVITDRRVLDKQLQDTIYQFEHARGVVEKIDIDSAQLSEALAGHQARIIITTLQKFPFVLEKGVELPDRRYAVIVDEAHSSQTGEAAKDLKLVLGTGPEQQLSAAEAEELALTPEPIDDVEDALALAAAARSRQPNLSFFAFTATPKARTLELFGILNPATGKHEPFHLYSMRQAIEEGFILDVLAQYVTYKTFWNIEKTTPDDPEYDPAKARTAIARFVSLHDHNLAQKAEVIIEHFRQKVARRIGGRAKAIVVTASRLHAVRYQQALRKYVTEHGYDIGILVAFSGKVIDGGADRTEANMNAFPESQTADKFATDQWQVLVVAEKYQTGFDQPLLCAMYVDKALTGLNAVQTLSRLNRIHPLKRQDDVFVLDFRNEAEDIRTAFEPWYGKTVAPPTDPNLLYDTRHQLDAFDVLRPEESEGAVALIVGTGRAGDHARIHAALSPAVDRFWALSKDDQEAFRDALNRFVRTYSFLSQVVAFTDAKLERDYICAKALSAFLKAPAYAGVDLGSEVELTYLRMDETFTGSVSLTAREGEVSTIFAGTGPQRDPSEEPLSQIIHRLNERFGTAFDPADRVFFDAIAEKLVRRPDIQRSAAANTKANFGLDLDKAFNTGVLDQLTVSEDMAMKYLDNSELQDMVLAAYLPMIYNKARVAHQEHCPIGELINSGQESATLEYKATLRTHADGGSVSKPLEAACLKTVAAFLNSRDGGTLLIGVNDDGTIQGLGADYDSLRKPGRDDRDAFQQHLANVIAASMGTAAASNVTIRIHAINGDDIARVHVRPSSFPV